MATTIEAPDREALAWVALTQAGHDHADNAEVAIQKVPWDELRSALAVAVARHGNHARAMRLISETASPSARALTLDAITTQSPEPAYRRLVAEVIGTDEWLWVLPAVAALDPHALHRFCDQLL